MKIAGIEIKYYHSCCHICRNHTDDQRIRFLITWPLEVFCRENVLQVPALLCNGGCALDRGLFRTVGCLFTRKAQFSVITSMQLVLSSSGFTQQVGYSNNVIYSIL